MYSNKYINSTLTTSDVWDISLKNWCVMCLSKPSPNLVKKGIFPQYPRYMDTKKAFHCLLILLGGQYGGNVNALQGRKGWSILHVSNIDPVPDGICVKIV